MTAHTPLAPSKSSLVLQAQSLTCVRGEKELFANLSFEVKAGHCLHVRGENGVGKTSLLRLLAGLSKPESGQILWNEEAIASTASAYHASLLFLGHRDALKEELSAIENLQMYAHLDAVSLTNEKALSALWRFGLRGRESLPVHYLSAGQKRRVLMARMLTRQAPLWLLDEPFNALDVKAISELERLMEEHLSAGGLLVLTSHQPVNIPGVKVLEL